MTITINDVLHYVEILFRILTFCGITIEFIPQIKISPLKFLGTRLLRSTNDRIDKIQKQVDTIEYENDMKDLRNVKSRIHQCGYILSKGGHLSDEMIKSAFDDLDVYDFYKERYKTMNINGKKIKINGEVEVDRELLRKAATHR